MHALDWIGYIIEWIGNFIPRIAHIKKTHKGVMYTRSGAKIVDAGMHVYLPLWTSLELYPIKRQTLNIPPQTLTTKNGETLLVAVAVIYYINDVYRALVGTYELQDTISDICQQSVKYCILQHSFDEIIQNQEEIDEEICADISSSVIDYGVGIENAFITDIAKVKVLKIVSYNNNIIN